MSDHKKPAWTQQKTGAVQDQSGQAQDAQRSNGPSEKKTAKIIGAAAQFA